AGVIEVFPLARQIIVEDAHFLLAAPQFIYDRGTDKTRPTRHEVVSHSNGPPSQDIHATIRPRKFPELQHFAPGASRERGPPLPNPTPLYRYLRETRAGPLGRPPLTQALAYT